MVADIFDLSDGVASAVDAAVAVLKAGGLAVIPTETVYGLVADASRPDACEKIYRVKERERGKPLQLLVSGVEVIGEMGFNLNATERKLAKAFWPGGMTLVVEGSAGSEGFRVPDSEIALEIVRRVGGALRSTSANLSGAPPALSAQEVLAGLGQRVDAVIDGGCVKGGTASTVVRVNAAGVIEILREGAVSIDAIFAAGS